MGRPTRNLSFNATGNVLSGTAMAGHALKVYRENAAIRQPKGTLVGSVTVPGSGQFSVGLTSMPLGAHVLRVVQDGGDLLSEPLSVTVTSAT
jgi:hypothetical protein